jgi:cytochrome c oxidase subunit 1
MATTEVRPDLTVTGEVRVTVPYRAGFLGWLTTTDHKRIAIMYAFTSFFFLLVGGTMALIFRTQLAFGDAAGIELPGVTVDQNTYNQLITMHGTIMVFLFLMPMLAAFGNYIVPLQIGALDMAFPRVNAFSYWLVPIGGAALLLSYFTTSGPPAAGWTSYSPLAGPKFSAGPGVSLWIASLALLGTGSLLGAINFMVTILKLRAPGMTMMRLPLFCWTMIVQSLLVIFSLPVITAGLLMLFIDRTLGGGFFDPTQGGDVVLYQHIFWYFGHPEVYILILPLMGAVSEIIPTFSRKPIFGYKAFIFATLAIGALGTAVWAHHMFTTGAVSVTFFAAMSFTISVPTGVKMFNWIATMYKGKVQFTSAMLNSLGFLMMFLIGGITGVFLASGSLDFAMHDTYFVVAHFHYVLVSAALFAMFGAFFYWFPKMSGRMLSEKLGKWQFWLMFLSVNLTFFPQFIGGLNGMTRRYQYYPEDAGFNTVNVISTLGSYLLGVAVLLFMINFVVSVRRGPIAGDDPWDGYTLEWATSSPPPYYNFESLPPIRSERPLFDVAHPGHGESHGWSESEIEADAAKPV